MRKKIRYIILILVITLIMISFYATQQSLRVISQEERRILTTTEEVSSLPVSLPAPLSTSSILTKPELKTKTPGVRLEVRAVEEVREAAESNLEEKKKGKITSPVKEEKISRETRREEERSQGQERLRIRPSQQELEEITRQGIMIN